MDTVDEVEIKYKCTVCTSELDDVIKTRYDVMVCNDCVVICRRCDDILSTNDEFNDVEGDTWCQSCTSDSAHWCDMCENYFTGYTYGADDTSDCMCERCYENNTTYCEDCDATYVNGCEYNHDDEADGRVIHDYSYRPDPIFHSSEDEQTRLYFGIEVETEVRNQNYTQRRISAEYASIILESENLAYLKSDGSLACGFEIVTHPLSHSYFMNDAGTLRFLQLVYNNKDFYEVMAGRSSSHWAKFDDNVDPNTGQKSFKHKFDRHGSDRYSAVNTNNRNTLEMRIFRGSLNQNYIKACIDLAHASVEFTRVMSVPEIRNHKLDCINLIQYIRDRNELYPALNARLDRLSSVISRIERKENVSISSKFPE